MRPVVGITPCYDMDRGCFWMPPGYLQAVEACGAVPLVLAQSCDPEVFGRSLDMVDGLLLTGGCDLGPERYGARWLPCCNQVQPERDNFEFALFERARRMGLPVLGVCRGMQLVNVAYGGTLYQDLATQMPGALDHRVAEPLDLLLHDVAVLAGSPLAERTGAASLAVNSRHHQGVCELAAGLRAMALAGDGLVEALFDPAAAFVWGVQWHPENLWQRYPAHRAVIQAFVAACQ